MTFFRSDRRNEALNATEKCVTANKEGEGGWFCECTRTARGYVFGDTSNRSRATDSRKRCGWDMFGAECEGLVRESSSENCV